MLFNSVIAQEALPLKPGDRLRVTAPSWDMFKEVVTFVALREDSLIVSADTMANWEKKIRIEVDKIQKIEVVIQNKGQIKGSVTGTSDSTIHILDKTGQQHSIHVDQIKRIKYLALKKDREVKKRYFYTMYVQSLTDSTIIISSEKELAPLEDQTATAWPLSSITHFITYLDVQRVQKSSGGKGALIGSVIGAAGGLAVAAGACSSGGISACTNTPAGVYGGAFAVGAASRPLPLEKSSTRSTADGHRVTERWSVRAWGISQVLVSIVNKHKKYEILEHAQLIYYHHRTCHCTFFDAV